MHFAICYVSTAAPKISTSEIEELLEHSCSKNSQNKITGILLFSNGNFFQVLEGEKEAVIAIFEKISEDKRHYDLIPIFRREIQAPQFDKYKSDFLSLDTTYRKNDIDLYTSQINNLDPSIQNSVKYILKTFS